MHKGSALARPPVERLVAPVVSLTSLDGFNAAKKMTLVEVHFVTPPPQTGEDEAPTAPRPTCNMDDEALAQRPLSGIGLVWLPGAGANPDNALLRRISNALHYTGVAAACGVDVVMGVFYEEAAAALANLKRRGCRHVILCGHSKGAGVASRTAVDAGCPFLLVGCGIPPVSKPPSCTIIGEFDNEYPGFNLRTHNKALTSCKSQKREDAPVALQISDFPVLAYIFRGSDHSLRHRPKPQMDKDKCAATPETERISCAAAEAIGTFLQLMSATRGGHR